MTDAQAIIKLINVGLFNAEITDDFSDVDFKQIFSLSERHSITRIVFTAIKKLNIPLDEKLFTMFDTSSKLTIVKYTYQNHEIGILKKAFEEAKIPFVILKGSRLRWQYPSPELRTSGDVDILFKADEEYATEIMSKYEYNYFADSGVTLNFKKQPYVVVELHRFLFDNKLDFHEYFNGVWDRVLPVRKGGYEYLMTEEDFYAYMVAHMVKHFSRYGCGIRPVIDLYVFHQNPPENFDYDKAKEILKKIGILEFEQRLLQLTDKWFNGGKTDEKDNLLTDYIIGAGLYGNSKITNARTSAKFKSVFAFKFARIRESVLPGFAIMQDKYKFLSKLPFLLPVMWIVRGFNFFGPKRAVLTKNINSMKTVNEKYVIYVNNIMEDLHIEN